MEMQRITALIKMHLKKIIREPAYLFLILLFPAILTFTFGVSFTSKPIITFGMNFPNLLTLNLAINLPKVEILPNLMLSIVLTLDTSTGVPILTYGLNFPETIAMDFNAMVPGLLSYACIFIIMTVSMSFATDRKEGLLKRLNTTPMTSAEFMGSHIISKMLIAILQVFIVFGIASLLGFTPNTDVSGISLAFCIMAIFSLSSVGLGLITATIAKNPEIAVGLSFVFILPQMFLGTFIPLNDSTRMLAMFFPSYFTTDALKSIFSGEMLTGLNILFDFTILSIFSVAVVIIGIQLFKKFGNA